MTEPTHGPAEGTRATPERDASATTEACPEELEVVAEVELEDGAPILEALLATARAALATDLDRAPAPVEAWWREEGTRPEDDPEAAAPRASTPHTPRPVKGPGDDRT